MGKYEVLPSATSRAVQIRLEPDNPAKPPDVDSISV